MRHLTGHIDRAIFYSGIEGRCLLSVEGWILHQSLAVIQMEIEVNGVHRGKIKRMKRPDVADRLKEISHAIDSGFISNIEIHDTSRESLELTLLGTLENGETFRTSFVVQPETAHFDFISSQLEGDAHASKLGSEESRNTLEVQSEIAFNAFLQSGETLNFKRQTLPRLSVVLVLHNQAALTYACLLSLIQHEDVGLEIIIVDNASTDKTAALLEKIHGAIIIKNQSNLHFIEGANSGARKATGDFLLFLNNDTVVYPGALAAAVQTLTRNPEVGVVGATLIRPDGKLQEAGSSVLPDGSTHGIGVGEDPFTTPYRQSFEVDYVSGAFLCTRKNLFTSLDGFDPRFSPAYYEDADYCFRLRALGFKTLFEPNALILHIQHASSETHTDAHALISRNKPIFAQRHLFTNTDTPRIEQKLEQKSRHGSAITAARILFIDDFLPIASRGQGLPRSDHIVRSLHAMGHSLSIAPTNETQESLAKYQSHIIPGVSVHSIEGDRVRALSTLIPQHDVVFVSRPHNMELLTRVLAETNCARPAILYDAEAIFAFREIYKKEALSGMVFTAEEKDTIIRKESSLAQNADVVLSVSEWEASHFRKAGASSVFVLSHMVHVRDAVPTFAQRKGFMTVGPVLAEDTPNADALLWFLGNVAPAIQKENPQDENVITIIGENRLSLLVSAMSPSARVLGVIPSLFPEYDRHKVFFAAHRYSAGIPLKLVEAASHGIPVLCTSLLSNQLGLSHQEACIADTPQEWITQCKNLVTDEELWRKYAERAKERVKREFSRERFIQSLRDALRAIGISAP